MITLCQKALSQIHGVSKPDYDRKNLKPAILHFGVGGFHRAHQAMYLDDLLLLGKTDWAICGIGVMEHDRNMRDILRRQDYLYSLITKYPDGIYRTRIIGSIIDYLFAPDDPEAVIEKIAHLDTKIISLTITEGGYNFNQATGEFDFDHPDIVHDLQSPHPKTVFGLMIEGLKRRKDRKIPPPTIQSCDNIQANGDMSKKMFCAYGQRKYPNLAKWIIEHVSFPNSMVDRITPVTTKDDILWLQQHHHLDDGWPVVCEPFSQWVIEDDFCNGRPPYETLSVQMTEDVLPYELMKLRLLNASHQALAYFGYLSGYRYVHEVCKDDHFISFLKNFMHLEAEPTLLPLADVDLKTYQQTLIKRFANAEIADTLARLCTEGSDRIPKWLVGIIWDQLKNNDPQIKRCAAVIASWARYMEGYDEHNQPIDINDRLKEKLTPLAQAARKEDNAFIDQHNLFGKLSENKLFMQHYKKALNQIYQRGAYETMKEFM